MDRIRTLKPILATSRTPDRFESHRKQYQFDGPVANSPSAFRTSESISEFQVPIMNPKPRAGLLCV